jgi:predicted secreted hydrolase
MNAARRRLAGGWLAVTVTAAIALAGCGVGPDRQPADAVFQPASEATIGSAAPARAGDPPDPRWMHADPEYRLDLPRDHASHPEHKIEWWYYTGNVSTAEGRRFGYQLTFFRVGVDPAPVNPSRWAIRDLHMAHLAVADIDGERYRFADRLNRAGVGGAGASTASYDVWNEDWRATLDASGRHLLRATDAGLGLDLVLEPGKPWVAHGRQGYSQKGSQPRNASHYYSLTRMSTRGRLAIGGDTFQVEGASWMDHEFGSSVLEPDHVGWDWFSIQLEDGTDLMVFQLRQRDGSPASASSGTLVLADGGTVALAASAFTLTPGDSWRSPASGAIYPIAWRVTVPERELVLDVRAALPDQELRTERSTGVTYWEGSIDVRGQQRGRPIRGRGYLEMTGYTGAPMSDILR